MQKKLNKSKQKEKDNSLKMYGMEENIARSLKVYVIHRNLQQHRCFYPRSMHFRHKKIAC